LIAGPSCSARLMKTAFQRSEISLYSPPETSGGLFLNISTSGTMITVVGSVNLDLTGIVNHFPKPGETITCTSFRSSPGGKGANQALAARRSGSGVSLIGAVGEDGAATVAMELLEEAGVDLKQVQ